MEVEKILDKNGNPSRLKKKANPEVLEQILKACPHEDENSSIYMYLHEYKKAPACAFCQGPLKIRNFKLGFASKWCSTKCRDSDPNFKIQMKESLSSYDKKDALRKRKQTNIDRYGVEHQLQRPELMTKVSKINTINRDLIVEKIRQTCLDRYGVHCSFLVPSVQEKIAAVKESYPQKKVREFVESLGFECKTDRTLISPYEIDILVPEKKIGIEINGVYWHSSYDKDSDKVCRVRHLSKTRKMSERGFRLIHFTDIEVLDKESIVFSMIASVLGKSKERVYARDTKVCIVDSKTAKEFLNKTHIQGAAPCSHFMGLFNENTLVSVMGFSKSRFDKSYDWELIRFSSSLNTTVVGGFSKLLASFRKRFTGTIVSYADFSRSNGDVYIKNGFQERGVSKPSYRWVDLNKGELYNRHLFMRRNLPRILGEKFNPDETEAENCWRAGFRKIWDCGQIKFSLT